MHITQLAWLLLQNWYSERVCLDIRLKSSLNEFYTDYRYFCNKTKPNHKVLGKIKFHYNFTKILSTDSTKKQVYKHQTSEGLFFYGLCIKLAIEEVKSLMKKESKSLVYGK